MTAFAAELARLLAGRLPGGAELEAIRLRRLRRLAESACRDVPFQRERFDRAGLRPRDLRSVEDLRHLPVTTRDEMRAAGEAAFARGVDRAAGHWAPTSGSTGRPWSIFRTRQEERLRRATEFRSMRWAGVRPRDVVGSLGPLRPTPRRPLERLGLYRTIQVSPLASLEEQATRLREVAPSVLWFYPSALRALLGETGELGGIARPRLLIHSAEPLDEPLRRRIGAGERIESRNFYGSVEMGRIAWECAERDGLHLNADCVVLELVADDDVPGAGSSVVVTNLNSHAMPFLRYRLGDRCELAPGPCRCGAPLPRIRPPVGREWDILRLPSGRLLSPWGVNIFLRSLDRLLQYRLRQTAIDRLRLEMRFSGEPDPAALAGLREGLARHLGEPMHLELVRVDRFEEGALKFRTFVSDLPKPG